MSHTLLLLFTCGYKLPLKLDMPLCFQIIRGVKTVNTTSTVVCIATCFDPKGSSQPDDDHFGSKYVEINITNKDVLI
jgi:hypothetical protein